MSNEHKLKSAAKKMDWMQIVLNGGPPCFHIEPDGRFCGRAERRHDEQASAMFHSFEPLERLVQNAIREGMMRAAEIVVPSKPIRAGVSPFLINKKQAILAAENKLEGEK